MDSDSEHPLADPRHILDRMEDGFFAVDPDWRIIYANDRAQAILRAAMPDDSEAGDVASGDAGDGDAAAIEDRHLWDVVPDAVDTTFYDRYHEAMDTGESVSFEAEYAPIDTWFDVRVFPSDSGLSIYFRDITDQKRLREEQAASLQALQQLYAISSDFDRDFEAKLEAILTVGCEYLDMPNGFLTQIDHGTQYIQAAVATHPELQPGASCPLDEAYCKRTIERDQLLTVVNAVEEGWEDDPAYERFDLGTYIGGRVDVDGSLYGTLCFADTASRDDAFPETRKTFVELLTRWVSYELERKLAEDRLKRERDRLDEFASVVSHDLRNPLNTATARLELLQTDVDSEHLPPLDRALDRMEELIDDLLTLSREGMVVEETEPFRLDDTVRVAWGAVDAPEATLAVELENSRVVGDESRVKQLFENLFRNAVDHGPSDVTVTVGNLDDGFFVADDGPGIPEDEREKIFETGYTTSEGGTGFGLSIVEQIVDAHGWEIDATESERGGARFEVRGVDRPD